MIYKCVHCGSVMETKKSEGNYTKCSTCKKTTLPYYDVDREEYAKRYAK